MSYVLIEGRVLRWRNVMLSAGPHEPVRRMRFGAPAEIGAQGRQIRPLWLWAPAFAGALVRAAADLTRSRSG